MRQTVRETLGKIGIALVVPYLVVSLLILVLLGGIIYYSYSTQIASIHELQNATLRTTADDIDGYIEGLVQGLMFTRTNIECVQCTDERINTLLRSTLDSDPSMYEIRVLDTQGAVVHAVAKFELADGQSGAQVLSRERFLESLHTDTYTISEPYTSSYGLPSISLSVPILAENGSPIGVLLSEVDLSPLWGRIVQANLKESGYAYVVDSEGDLIVFRDVQRVRRNENLSHIRGVQNFRSDTRGPDSYRSFTGERVIGAARGVTLTEWGVVVELPYREVLQEIGVLFAVGAASVVLLGVALFVPLRIIFKEILAPVRGLREGVQEIERGNLNFSVPVTSTTELGDLANSFNSMSRRIKAHYRELEEKVAERTQALADAQEHLQDKVRELEKLNIVMAGRKEDVVHMESVPQQNVSVTKNNIDVEERDITPTGNFPAI